MRELTNLRNSPPEDIRLIMNDEDLLAPTGIIAGPSALSIEIFWLRESAEETPEDTPYQTGFFNVVFQFTSEWPAAPPKCRFTTRIFHPNVNKAGEICVSALKKDWKREMTITDILLTIKCLLIHPNPESALDEDAGKLLLEHYDDYFKRAALMTSVHARSRPAEFTIPTTEAASQPTTAAPTSTPSAQSTTTSTSPSKLPPHTSRHSRNASETSENPVQIPQTKHLNASIVPPVAALGTKRTGNLGNEKPALRKGLRRL